MQSEHQLIAQVAAAKSDMRKADDLIRAYLPFIRSEASEFLSRIVTEHDDEYSIAMIAFHEAIRGYNSGKGAFLAYASMTIRSRLTDYARKEARHRGQISLDEERDDDTPSLADTLTDERDEYDESDGLAATQQEIAELSRVMSDFGVTLTDIAENSPKQARTLDACARAVRHAAANPSLLDELLHTKKLPLAALAEGSGVERKTLERHRRYVLAMLLVQTNGYEIIRGHIKHVLSPKGGAVR